MGYACPDGPWGEHRPDHRRICQWCGIRVPGRHLSLDTFGDAVSEADRIAREQDPLTIEPDEGSYYDEDV